MSTYTNLKIFFGGKLCTKWFYLHVLLDEFDRVLIILIWLMAEVAHFQRHILA